MEQSYDSSIIQESAVLLTGLFPQDVPSVFIPYIVFLIDEKRYVSLNVEIVARDFLQMFGIDLPPLVVDKLLDESEKREYIYFMQGVYTSNPLKIKSAKFSKEYRDALSRYEELKKFYREFVVNEKGLPELTDGELDKAALNVIEKVSLDSNPENVKDLPDAYEMALNDFILYANNTHPEIVEVLNQFAVSNALWNVIANKQEPIQYFKKEAKIFLDTRCIFRLIGLEGEYWKNVFEAFASSIKDNGGSVVVFKHVMEEINNILKNARNIYKSDDFDIERASMVARQFRYEGYNDAKIDALIYNLNYNSNIIYGFTIEEHDYNKATDEYQVDYESLKSKLIELYKKNNPEFDVESKGVSIETDIRSLTMAYRIRAGNRPISVSEVDVIFVTTNTCLAKISKKFDKDYGVPVCLTANYLSTFIWLGTPTKYIAQNKNKILAFCYAAICPTSEQIKEYFFQIEELKKQKSFSKEQLSYMRDNPTLMRLYTLISSSKPTDKKPTLLESVEIYKQQSDRKAKEIENEKRVIEEELNEYKKRESEKEKLRRDLNKRANDNAGDNMKILEDGIIPVISAVVLFIIAFFSFKFVPTPYVKEIITTISVFLGVLFSVFTAIIKANKSFREKIRAFLIRRYLKKHSMELMRPQANEF